MFTAMFSINNCISGAAVTCSIRLQRARARVDGWLPSCGLITDAVIIITIIIIAIVITVSPNRQPLFSTPSASSCSSHTAPPSMQHWRENQYSFRSLHRPTMNAARSHARGGGGAVERGNSRLMSICSGVMRSWTLVPLRLRSTAVNATRTSVSLPEETD